MEIIIAEGIFASPGKVGKCDIIYLKWGISKYIAFLEKRQVSSRRRRRSRQDSHYATKNGG